MVPIGGCEAPGADCQTKGQGQRPGCLVPRGRGAGARGARVPARFRGCNCPPTPCACHAPVPTLADTAGAQLGYQVAERWHRPTPPPHPAPCPGTGFCCGLSPALHPQCCLSQGAVWLGWGAMGLEWGAVGLGWGVVGHGLCGGGRKHRWGQSRGWQMPGPVVSLCLSFPSSS